MDDGAAADGVTGDKLWHQQQLASGAEHTPLGAAPAADSGAGSSDATMKVRKPAYFAWDVELL
jgi:hypothetical protein